MSDKEQLAALGAEMESQQAPLCMAKRIEELTELLREVAPCVTFMINRIGDSETLRHATQLAEHIDEVLDSSQLAATPHQVPEGWCLVPVEITRQMWDAVNKLDDAMYAAGDHHGASIEQCWDCLLAAAPKLGENP